MDAGALRQQQATVAKWAFEKFAGVDNLVDRDELPKLAEYLGFPLIDGDADITLGMIDKDESDQIEEAEFVTWWVERSIGNESLRKQQEVVSRRAVRLFAFCAAQLSYIPPHQRDRSRMFY